jgi:hypothetical protein
MNVIYTDRARQRGEESALLQGATRRLEDVLGQSAGLVTAEWDRVQDERGRPPYRLTISDRTGSVSTDFALTELTSSSHMRGRLLQLWGDLLQIRSHRQLQVLTESAGQPGE